MPLVFSCLFMIRCCKLVRRLALGLASRARFRGRLLGHGRSSLRAQLWRERSVPKPFGEKGLEDRSLTEVELDRRRVEIDPCGTVNFGDHELAT